MSAEALGTGRPWDRHVWEGTHSLVVKAHYLATSEPILATLNALMVECTERIGRLTDRRGRDGRDSNVQSRFINPWARTSCRGLIARQRFGCRTFSSEETGRGKERKATLCKLYSNESVMAQVGWGR